MLQAAGKLPAWDANSDGRLEQEEVPRVLSVTIGSGRPALQRRVPAARRTQSEASLARCSALVCEDGHQLRRRHVAPRVPGDEGSVPIAGCRWRRLDRRPRSPQIHSLTNYPGDNHARHRRDRNVSRPAGRRPGHAAGFAAAAGRSRPWLRPLRRSACSTATGRARRPPIPTAPTAPSGCWPSRRCKTWPARWIRRSWPSIRTSAGATGPRIEEAFELVKLIVSRPTALYVTRFTPPGRGLDLRAGGGPDRQHGRVAATGGAVVE